MWDVPGPFCAPPAEVPNAAPVGTAWRQVLGDRGSLGVRWINLIQLVKDLGSDQLSQLLHHHCACLLLFVSFSACVLFDMGHQSVTLVVVSCYGLVGSL